MTTTITMMAGAAIRQDVKVKVVMVVGLVELSRGRCLVGGCLSVVVHMAPSQPCTLLIIIIIINSAGDSDGDDGQIHLCVWVFIPVSYNRFMLMSVGR